VFGFSLLILPLIPPLRLRIHSLSAVLLIILGIFSVILHHCPIILNFSVWKFRISKIITSMIPHRSSHSDGVPYSSSSLPGSSSRSLYMGGCSSHQGGLRVSSNVLVTPDFS
jgi:hypothetical protein